MNDRDLLAQRFETHRQHLRAVALRMLGSSHEADDAVQEAWLRLSRTDADAVENLGGWLTTVVARVCLDMLRARAARPEALADAASDPVTADFPRGRGSCLLTRSAWLCWWCWTPWRQPSGSPSCCTTCSPFRSRRSPRSWAERQSPPASSRAVPVGGCSRTLPSPMRLPPLSARWSPRSLPPRARGTSPRCFGCSIPTWSCGPMPWQSTWPLRERMRGRRS